MKVIKHQLHAFAMAATLAAGILATPIIAIAGGKQGAYDGKHIPQGGGITGVKAKPHKGKPRKIQPRMPTTIQTWNELGATLGRLPPPKDPIAFEGQVAGDESVLLFTTRTDGVTQRELHNASGVRRRGSLAYPIGSAAQQIKDIEEGRMAPFTHNDVRRAMIESDYELVGGIGAEDFSRRDGIARAEKPFSVAEHQPVVVTRVSGRPSTYEIVIARGQGAGKLFLDVPEGSKGFPTLRYVGSEISSNPNGKRAMGYVNDDAIGVTPLFYPVTTNKQTGIKTTAKAPVVVIRGGVNGVMPGSEVTFVNEATGATTAPVSAHAETGSFRVAVPVAGKGDRIRMEVTTGKGTGSATRVVRHFFVSKANKDLKVEASKAPFEQLSTYAKYGQDQEVRPYHPVSKEIYADAVASLTSKLAGFDFEQFSAGMSDVEKRELAVVLNAEVSRRGATSVTGTHRAFVVKASGWRSADIQFKSTLAGARDWVVED